MIQKVTRFQGSFGHGNYQWYIWKSLFVCYGFKSLFICHWISFLARGLLRLSGHRLYGFDQLVFNTDRKRYSNLRLGLYSTRVIKTLSRHLL